MKKVLIIEDDKIKIERLRDFFSDSEICVKESFRSGVLELKQNFQNYNFLILDMTIPLWEKGNNDLGGNYEQFGGKKVLKEMKRRKLLLPTILFTMFDIFPTPKGNITFKEIDKVYKKEFSDFFVGAVFYSANEEDWKTELSTLISTITDKE